MKSAKSKRQLTILTLILALGVAVYLNWEYAKTDSPFALPTQTQAEDDALLANAQAENTPVMEALPDKNYGEAQLVSVSEDSSDQYFETARLTRTKTRDEALDKLQQSLKATGLTEEEKAQRRIFYAEQFRKATQTAVQDGYDVLFLDEIVYTIRAGLFDEAMLIDFLKNKPEHLEVILTGRDPSPGLIELADYVSEIRKVKHPFDRGLPARRGIEC